MEYIGVYNFIFISTVYKNSSYSCFSTVTFGLKPTKGKFYDAMPLTSNDAVSAGWKNVSSSCFNGKFSGYRFILGDDTSINLLYNVNGVISGIQLNVNIYLIHQIHILAHLLLYAY